MAKIKDLFQTALEQIEERNEIEEKELESIEESLEESEEVVESFLDEEAENSDTIDELCEISTGMDGVAEFLEGEVERGGIDKTAAAAVNLAVEAYIGRLGVEVSPVASMESFTETNKLPATQISLEGVKETLVKVWEAIKKAIKKAIDAVIGFFKYIFDVYTRIRHKARKLTAKVDEVGGSIPVGEITIPHALHFKGMHNGKAVIDGLGALKDAAKLTYEDYVKGVAEYYKTVRDISMSIKGELKIDRVDALDKEFNKAYRLFDKVKSLDGRELPGNVRIKRRNPAGKNIRDHLLVVTKPEGKAEKAKGEKPLSVVEMKKTIKLVEEIVDIVEHKKDAVKALTKAREEAVYNIDISLNRLKFNTGVAGALHNAADTVTLGVKPIAERVYVRALFAYVNSDFTRVVSQLTAITAKTLTSALKTVQDSLSKYSEKEGKTSKLENKSKEE